MLKMSQSSTQCILNSSQFSLIIRSLFESYSSSMLSVGSSEELSRSVLAWLQQHCSLVALRPGMPERSDFTEINSWRDGETSPLLVIPIEKLPFPLLCLRHPSCGPLKALCLPHVRPSVCVCTCVPWHFLTILLSTSSFNLDHTAFLVLVIIMIILIHQNSFCKV